MIFKIQMTEYVIHMYAQYAQLYAQLVDEIMDLQGIHFNSQYDLRLICERETVKLLTFQPKLSSRAKILRHSSCIIQLSRERLFFHIQD